MGFKDAAEVRKYLGGVFETAFADPEVGPKLRATGIVLKTVYSDPEATLVIDTTSGSVREAQPDDEASAEMSMTADTGNAYWQGKVNLPLAMAKSRIKVTGNVASLLKLAPLGKKLYPAYIETLTADGRDDLLV
ncbi:SCP2 sterol-binding domain-containing protein [Gordonia polyisoprenivorans]|uniref:SCP2 sterol-binding domain-containing protein n=1 Tax=Gordonia polyisoprenivorans TaxID=84595 RepID=UPI001AD7E10F|nr:SCP2 sterol-binding domain-containing protein [Gordonia polyisoprenivorans]QTI69012.1 SCP2 sterol-binding domain-containing protein [Gordonia polyisoprenivorans]